MSSTPRLQVDNVRPAPAPGSQGQARLAADGVSLALAAGERVALVGPPGAGKSRLARAIALIDAPQAGRIWLEGADVTRVRGSRQRDLRRALQYIGGDPRRSLPPRLPVRDILVEPLQVHSLGAASERHEQVARAAEAWGLNPLLLSASAADLSAALCQRVGLARAWLLGPRVLVCDELAARVEPAAARHLLARLSDLCRGRGVTWLWTTTDLDLAREYSDRVFRVRDAELRPA